MGQLVPNRVKGVVGTVIFLVVLGAAGFFYYQYQDIKKHPDKLTTQEIALLKERMGKLIELPAGEEPTLATVTDADALKKDQTFFANAQNGDKVLIYYQAKKAFLYRPSTDKIIEVGPVTLDASPSATATPTPTLTRPATPRPTSTATPTPSQSAQP